MLPSLCLSTVTSVVSYCSLFFSVLSGRVVGILHKSLAMVSRLRYVIKTSGLLVDLEVKTFWLSYSVFAQLPQFILLAIHNCPGTVNLKKFSHLVNNPWGFLQRLFLVFWSLMSYEPSVSNSFFLCVRVCNYCCVQSGHFETNYEPFKTLYK